MTLLNILVALWLAITSAGLIYSIRLSHRAVQAKDWLRVNGLNGYRGIVANGAIYRGRIRVVMSSCMVLMGVDAGVIQFFPVGSDVRNVLSAMFRLLFILMALGFSYKSYLEDHELDLLVNEDQRRTIKSRVGDRRGERIDD